ncbi:hypothetical protein EVAR_58854_1 [Eumeta japonica]|uniref:Uncharacterized protein n=1 Tax=Eumeta variegata TaxID=151549 RepID=A0A4C1YB61_EUMVA|nr:hypothetical protein EVAR_58854_1 [Eumeta japonica]
MFLRASVCAERHANSPYSVRAGAGPRAGKWGFRLIRSSHITNFYSTKLLTTKKELDFRGGCSLSAHKLEGGAVLCEGAIAFVSGAHHSAAAQNKYGRPFESTSKTRIRPWAARNIIMAARTTTNDTKRCEMALPGGGTKRQYLPRRNKTSVTAFSGTTPASWCS